MMTFVFIARQHVLACTAGYRYGISVCLYRRLTNASIVWKRVYLSLDFSTTGRVVTLVLESNRCYQFQE